MAKRIYTKRSTPAKTNSGTLIKALRHKSSEMTHFIGDVEFSTISDTLLKMNAIEVCGYSTKLESLVGTPIYSYIQYHRDRFTSVSQIATVYFFPRSEIETLVKEYFSIIETRKVQSAPLTPEMNELLHRLREKPELATALLELVS